MGELQNGFVFSKVSLTAEGALMIAGSLPGPAPAGSGLQRQGFVLARRGGGPERYYPAECSPGPNGCQHLLCSIPLEELDFGLDELVDFYFEVGSPDTVTRTRVAWPRESRRWLPYPTKYGNLSLRRNQP